MTQSKRSPVSERSGEQAVRDEPKTRLCLRCNARFASEWSGERICTRCKGTTAWRNGLPYKSHTGSGRS